MLDPWSNHRTVHLDGWCDPGYPANHTAALLAARAMKLLSSFATKTLLKQLVLEVHDLSNIWGKCWNPYETMTVRLSSSQALLPVHLCNGLKNSCGAGNNSAFVAKISATNIFGLKLNTTKSFRHLMWEILEDWMEFFHFSGNFHWQKSPTSLMLSTGVLQFLVILLQLAGLWHPFTSCEATPSSKIKIVKE